ncbi:acyl-CoA desaturase [Alcaligenes aquatilis]|uniref:acyl-CoA desaturase n=1 Tax=Alcaligenes aquatilis TaxID=323284 RepID=UPI003623E315
MSVVDKVSVSKTVSGTVGAGHAPSDTNDKLDLKKVGIAPLVGKGARQKQLTAFSIMSIPLIGFLICLWWIYEGRVTTLDYILFTVFYVIQMLGITVGFHRYLAHKTFSTSKVFEGILLICGSMAGQGPIMFWVTTHRRHHTFSDKPGDPHSPNLIGNHLWGRIKGLWYAHMPWMMAKDVSVWTVFAPDILSSRRLFFYHRTYFWWLMLGLILPAAIGGFIGGSIEAAIGGFLFGGLGRMFLANQAAWCVGSLSHMIGSRPFRTNDSSANNWTVAIFTFGEGLQNNHHAFPGSYRHGMKWWEPDLSGWFLKLLSLVGVVWGLKHPDLQAIEQARI